MMVRVTCGSRMIAITTTLVKPTIIIVVKGQQYRSTVVFPHIPWPQCGRTECQIKVHPTGGFVPGIISVISVILLIRIPTCDVPWK